MHFILSPDVTGAEGGSGALPELSRAAAAHDLR